MLVGGRIRAIREAKNLSQEDLQRRSGLLRVHISRIENNHSVPSVETLEKFAHALDIPLYQFFYEGTKHASLDLHERMDRSIWGANRKDIRFGEKLRHLLARMGESDRRLLLRMAEKMARR